MKRILKNSFKGMFWTMVVAVVLLTCVVITTNKQESVAIGSFCSGFVVADGYVMTAHHCFENSLIGESVTVRINKEFRTFTLYSVSPIIDAAILSGPTHGVKPPKLQTTPPKFGEHCTGRGFPMSSEIELTTDLTMLFWRGPDLWMKGTGEFGFSGGPIWNDRNEVVGITVRMSHYFVIAVPAAHLQMYFDQKEQYRNSVPFNRGDFNSNTPRYDGNGIVEIVQ